MQGHVPFGNRFFGADLEPAFLDLRPIAADVAGIDGDVEVGEGFSGRRGGEGGGALPVARCGQGVFGGGEVQDEGGFGGIRDDPGGGFGNGDVGAPGFVGGEDFGEEFFEIAAGDGVLVCVQGGPVGRLGEDGEIGVLGGRRSGWCRLGLLRAEQEEDNQGTEQQGGDDGGGVAHRGLISSKP